MATASCTVNNVIHASEDGACWVQKSWQALTAAGSVGTSRPFVVKFTVPAAAGETAGRTLSFSLPVFLSSAQTGNTSITLNYYVTNGAPDFTTGGSYATNMATQGTVLASGTFAMTGLSQSVQQKSFTTGAMTLPASGGTYYLWLRDGGKVISIGHSSYASMYSATMTYTSTTVTTGWTITGNRIIGSASVVVTLPTLTGANVNNYHVITYAFGSVSGTITSSLKSGQSVTWTPPYSLGTQIPNATSGTGAIYCTTYSSSGATVGSNSLSLTLSFPNNSTTKPSFSRACSPVDPGGNSLYVQTVGAATLTTSSISAKYGASIRNLTITITNESSPYNGTPGSSVTVTTGRFASSGSKTITWTLTDSRGFTQTATTAITVYAWTRPSITSFRAFRTASSTSTAESADGTYMRVVISTSGISSVNGKNTAVSSLTCSPTVSGIPSTTTSLAANYKIADTSSYTLSYSYRDDYTTNIASATVGSISVPLDFRYGGTGIGIGQYAQGNNRLDIGLNTFIHGNLSYSGQNQIVYEDIPSGADLNKYLTPGYYRSRSGSNSIANIPTDCASAFELTINSIGEQYCTQVIKPYNNNRRWTRSQTNYTTPHTWTDWQPIYTSDNTKRLLWSGTWSSGSITVPNTQNYRVFSIDATDTSMMLLGYYDPQAGSMFASASMSANVQTLTHFGLYATISGTIWTLQSARYLNNWASDSSGGIYDFSVTRIYGII